MNLGDQNKPWMMMVKAVEYLKINEKSLLKKVKQIGIKFYIKKGYKAV